MKVWMGYGSEHSMNLVLIGKFKHARDAEHMENLLRKIEKQAEKDEPYGLTHAGPENQVFSEEMIALLRAEKLFSLRPDELEQFVSEHHVERADVMITVTTQEVDVSAFIKLFIDAGARVELYSGNNEEDE